MTLFSSFSSISGGDFLNYFVVAYGSEKLSADENEFLKVLTQLDLSPYSKIQALKDFGNNLLRQHQFDEAGACYDTACRLLCSSLKDTTELDLNSVLSLAISLCLNLAACANKLQAFEEAMIFCSMVLNFFPRNAKALFRKAIALKKLNRFSEASSSLEEAKLIEPHNRDIIQELEDVRQSLVINKNGKRVLVDSLEASEDRAGKLFVSSSPSPEVISPPGKHDADMVEKMDVAASCASLKLGSDIPRKGNDSMLYPCPSACCVFECAPTAVPMASESNRAPDVTLNDATDVRNFSSSTDSNSPRVNFTNKKRPHTKLNLSFQDYDALIHGKKLGFYHPRSMSYMRVRTLTSKTIQTGTPHYGSAEVPTSSPTPETGSVAFVQEEPFLQVDKKAKLNSNSPSASKASSVQFKFVAISRDDRTTDPCYAKGRQGRCPGRNGPAFAASKKRSLVSVNVSTSFCRNTGTTATIMRMKRKVEHLIEFDAHYHPPFKKSRLFSLVATTSTVSFVTRISSNFGVTNTPLFVL